MAMRAALLLCLTVAVLDVDAWKPKTDSLFDGSLQWHDPYWQSPLKSSPGMWWLGQLVEFPDKYWCKEFDGIAPTCDQCMRGSGGLSMLPPSTDCGKCLRAPSTQQCTACWNSLPQVFDQTDPSLDPSSPAAEHELTVKTTCHIGTAKETVTDFADAGETFCGNGDWGTHPEELVSIGGLVTSDTWRMTVVQTAPLCMHLCRRWAFKLGADQVCCSVRDGEDYLPEDHTKIPEMVGSENAKCTAIEGMDPALGFVAGQQYPCKDMAGKDKRIMPGCWARRNAVPQEQPLTPYNTDQKHNDPNGKGYNPGISRAFTCQGFGGYYDTSGDVIHVSKGSPADDAGLKVGQRIMAIQEGDPAAPLLELIQPRVWVHVTDSSLTMVDVYVMRDLQGSIGCDFFDFAGSGPDGTGSGVKIKNVKQGHVGGIWDGAHDGFPEGWTGITGTPGAGPAHLWNCKGGKYCLPALRRGAKDGFIVKAVNGVQTQSTWDVERAMLTQPKVDTSTFPPGTNPCSNYKNTPDHQCFKMTLQIDIQANIDRFLSQCAPDDKLPMYGGSITPDNVGIKLRVRDGPSQLGGATKWQQGIAGGAQPGGDNVLLNDGKGHGSDTEKVFASPAPGQVTQYNEFNAQVGVPCEACIRQMPSPDAVIGCLQGMCDWSPRLMGYATEPPLKIITNIHSWNACQRECCVNDQCAAIIWYSMDLKCVLLPKPYEQTLVSIDQGAVAYDDAQCAKGCVSDRICEWTPTWEGTTPALIIKKVPSIMTFGLCKHECCKYGWGCKAVNWHTGKDDPKQWQCDLLSEFYDTNAHQPDIFKPEGDGRYNSNKWNGPLNPTCKWCIDSLPSINAKCAACKAHGKTPDCQQCWQTFAQLDTGYCAQCLTELPKQFPDAGPPGPNWHAPYFQMPGWWMQQLMSSEGRYSCPDLDGISPTCNQCIRGSGGLSMLPPSLHCGQCGRDPTSDNCGACWNSLPQIFDEPEIELTVKPHSHIRGNQWDTEGEAHCEGPPAEPLVSIGGLVVNKATWKQTVLLTAGLCEHLCRRWVLKMGGDQVCCSVVDGEDYPDLDAEAGGETSVRPGRGAQYGYGPDHMCTAIEGMQNYGNFVPGQQYKCSAMARKYPRIMSGCWARRNGWVVHDTPGAQGRTYYSTDQSREGGDPNGKLLNPGLSRAVEAEGLGAYYDASGDVISVKSGWAADRANCPGGVPAPSCGLKVGMRITQLQVGDPDDPLPSLAAPRKWVHVSDPANALVNVVVTKDPDKGIGASWRGVKVDAVDPSVKNGLFQAAMDGYPTQWAGVTGKERSEYNCQGGRFCLPACRRGARPGWIVRKIAGAEGQPDIDVVREWDIQRGLAAHPVGKPFRMTMQIDVQAVIDRYMSAVSPDKGMGMPQAHTSLVNSSHSIMASVPAINDVGFGMKVRIGPAALPFQGAGAGPDVHPRVGYDLVSSTGIIMDSPNSSNNSLGESGAPCEACIRQMPGVKVFAGCAQALCDFTPMAPPAAAEGTAAPLGTVSDTHSFWDCKRECCKNENCASLKWNAGQLTCDLYDVSYEVAGFKASAAAAENNDCAANGCVSDKICEWTPMYEGSSRQQVLQTVKKVRTLDECRLECCKKGSKCKAVGWHATPTDGSDNDCDLYGGFYDAVDWGKNGDGVFLSNKWNGPLNPTCKFCVDKMDVDAIDGVCTACKTHGLQADCDQCWQAFANAGPDCETCWAAFSPFLSHLWGIKPSAVASAEATARAAALRSHRAGAAAGVVAVALAAAAAAAAFARRRAAPPAAKAEEATYGAL